jgi:hypothetical protein
MIGLITLGRKPTGKRRAGNPHAAFEVAKAGNEAMGRTEAPGIDESPGNSYSPIPNTTAPVLGPSTEGFDTKICRKRRRCWKSYMKAEIRQPKGVLSGFFSTPKAKTSYPYAFNLKDFSI